MCQISFQKVGALWLLILSSACNVFQSCFVPFDFLFTICFLHVTHEAATVMSVLQLQGKGSKHLDIALSIHNQVAGWVFLEDVSAVREIVTCEHDCQCRC